MVSIISPTLPTPMEVSSPTLGEFSGVQCGKKATPRAPPQGIPARHFPLALPCCLTPAALLFCPPHLQAAPGLRAATSSQQGGNTGKKQRNKETKKQRNKETKKQRKKERKKERKSLLVGETCSGFLDRTYRWRTRRNDVVWLLHRRLSVQHAAFCLQTHHTIYRGTRRRLGKFSMPSMA